MLVEGFLDHPRPLFTPRLGDVTIAIRGKCIVQLVFEPTFGLVGKIYRYSDQKLRLSSKNMEKLSAIQYRIDGLVVQVLEVEGWMVFTDLLMPRSVG